MNNARNNVRIQDIFFLLFLAVFGYGRVQVDVISVLIEYIFVNVKQVFGGFYQIGYLDINKYLCLV